MMGVWLTWDSKQKLRGGTKFSAQSQSPFYFAYCSGLSNVSKVKKNWFSIFVHGGLGTKFFEPFNHVSSTTLWIVHWTTSEGPPHPHPLLWPLVYLLVTSRQGYFREVCSSPSSPRNVKPLMLFFMGAVLGVAIAAWGWGDSDQTCFDIFFPGYTQLLDSTDCQLIAVLFSAMSWGLNCSTNWSKETLAPLRSVFDICSHPRKASPTFWKGLILADCSRPAV